MSRAAAALIAIVLLAPAADARPDDPVRDALRRIRESVDPCGESREVAALLTTLARCPRWAVRISATAGRNLYDRRTITWNPALRSELEPACDRDPTASLLHELVHAAHACQGLAPGRDELEAVRIENIYRRAARLCQRTRYGDVPLPPAMRRDGTTCASAGGAVPSVEARGDSASPAGDAESAR